MLSTDLAPAQVQNNLAYYRELRGMLLKGRPIGNLDPTPARTGVRAKAETETKAAASALVASEPAPVSTGILTTAIQTDAAPLAGGIPAKPASPLPARSFTGPQ